MVILGIMLYSKNKHNKSTTPKTPAPKTPEAPKASKAPTTQPDIAAPALPTSDKPSVKKLSQTEADKKDKLIRLEKDLESMNNAVTTRIGNIRNDYNGIKGGSVILTPTGKKEQLYYIDVLMSDLDTFELNAISDYQSLIEEVTTEDIKNNAKNNLQQKKQTMKDWRDECTNMRNEINKIDTDKYRVNHDTVKI